MPVKQVINKGKVPVKIYTNKVDSLAAEQLINISKLPIIYHHVAAMPDVHAGIGATVGSVIPTKGAIIPAAVGVDIGCGMSAVQLSLKTSHLPNNLKRIRLAIEEAVPVGFNMHSQQDNLMIDQTLVDQLNWIVEKHPKIVGMQKRFQQTWIRQIGTLGGGNHFIELCFDEQKNLWLMLHSGSRGIGNIIGQYFISLAKKDMGQYIVNLPDKDLAYFKEGAVHFDDYITAVSWAQEYAAFNRSEMMRLILSALRSHLPDFVATQNVINCHHNYVAQETHFGEQVYLTRKGAIRAGDGELGIIPGSMGNKSYIVRGKGQEQSFCSCAHGAGRKMSRNKAKKFFSKQDLINQTKGVECRKDKGVIDEIPGAYKDIDQVMENQSDLVEIVHTLKQLICIKG